MASEPVPHLTDLVPKEALERQLQLFEALTGIPMVIVDATGVPVTPLTDPLRFCGTLVRDPEGRTVCLRRQKWDVPEEQLEREILGQHGGNKPDAAGAKALAAKCLERGLLILTCGIYADTVRLLTPLTASDAVLDEGLDILEAALLGN